jgi:sialidase-1
LRIKFTLFIAVLFPLGMVACAPSEMAVPTVDEATRAKALVILHDGLNSDEFWPSMHAAEGLTLAGYGDEVIAFLTPRLTAVTDGRQRCGIARELVRAGDSSQVAVLIEALRTIDPYAHTHAAESLYKLGLIGDEAAMRRAFESDDSTLHLMAAGALARRGDPEALQSIRTALEIGDPPTMQLAAWLLGRIGDNTDIARLKRRLDDAPEGLIRAYVQHSLAALGDEDGVRHMIENLSSGDPAIRTYAVTFAGESGGPAITPLLIPLLDDPDPDTRYRAAQSLLIRIKNESGK